MWEMLLRFGLRARAYFLAACLATGFSANAGTVLGPWIPIFQGIDRATGTNTPGGGGFPDLSVAQVVRVDLTDPDVKTFATPPCPDFIPDFQETPGMNVSTFVATSGVQVGINANFFNLFDQFAPAGTPMQTYGLHISEGRVVAAQEDGTFSASLLFSANNHPTLIPTNWPPQQTDGAVTAVTGSYPLLLNGENLGYAYFGDPAHLHQINPRSALGLSADHRYLYLLTIDGRQPGYSDGAYDWETAAWLKVVGAWDAINLDGGGSTTLVMQDPNGNPLELNHPSSVYTYGVERTVASHFGIFAKPLPIIHQVVANPDDTAATITWSTDRSASTQVQFGPTTNLGNSSALVTTPTRAHAVLLPHLTPGTGYYFRVLSTVGGASFSSALGYFVTTNYSAPIRVFEITNQWTGSAVNQDSGNWPAPGYDDSTWITTAGSLAMLTANQASAGNPGARSKVARLGNNPDSGPPFTTYYFRTHFQLNAMTGGTLVLSNFVNDGAVFYLNGTEISRLRMPTAPAAITNGTPALAEGQATELHPDVLSFTANALTNLVAGDNVLAVEVHSFRPSNPGIRFGAALVYLPPADPGPVLQISARGLMNTISWTRGGFTLQEAIKPSGPWRNVSGPVVSSPFVTPRSTAAHFYRLIK